jgi:hypothetical protein
VGGFAIMPASKSMQLILRDRFMAPVNVCAIMATPMSARGIFQMRQRRHRQRFYQPHKLF